MEYFITTTYLILIAAVLFLIILLVFNKNRVIENLEVNDALLNPEESERHAIELARNHEIGRDGSANWLVPRLNGNYKYIFEVYKALNEDVLQGFPAPPAAEWLLDNFYVIEEQVKDIRHSIGGKTHSKLPILKNGSLRGYPRVFAIALELISHNDARIDEKTVIDFIKSYQTQSVLSISELWAIAMMIRIALIGNLRHICSKIIETQSYWHKADALAKLISDNIEAGEGEILKLFKEHTKGMERLDASFVEHLMLRLRKLGGKSSAVAKYIDDRLAEQNSSIEALTTMEHQVQASWQVTIGNAITSLKLVSNMDWNDIFESLSHADQILKQDPSDIYNRMDFESKDYYRATVQKLARTFHTAETVIAKKTVECAAEAYEKNSTDLRTGHIGYYLIGRGKPRLEAKLGQKPSGFSGFAYSLKKHPGKLYFGTIFLGTAVLMAILAGYALYAGHASVPMLLLVCLLTCIPASDISIVFANFVFCRSYCPSVLPKLDLKNGIDPEWSTMVIVPTLLTGKKRVVDLLEQLEIYYLANKEKHLFFAIVGDFKDSTQKDCTEDEEIIDTAMKGIKELNKRYSDGQNDVFFYFHRERRYNAAQDRWMGWERKRGAIAELNELLLGNEVKGYQAISCDKSALPRVKYIITLDADTVLPIGTARRLIGALAHPMNHAVIDEESGTVVEGYGLLQPRIDIGVESANSTRFSRIYAGQGGIDPYTTAVSDVYQDLFEEGIFTGKGIYELETFQKVLRQVIPENAVLSHDLLEGSYVRTGLCTDIELVDGYPSKYNSYAMRLHRWVRGDWQLLPWLCSRVRNKDGDKVKNPLSFLSRWKIFDNLRRSLINPVLFLLITFGFFILPGSPLVWGGFAVVTVASHFLAGIVNCLLTANLKMPKRIKNSSNMGNFKAVAYQAVLQFIFIPYQAYLMLDAILRTIFRLFITRKYMLEWVTAADMEALLKSNAASFFRRMWMASALAVGFFILVLFVDSQQWIPALVPTVLWIFSFAVAYRISKKQEDGQKLLPDEDIRYLRRIARKTWRYFEDMVTETDNFLPPDNFQEDPANGIAHRTSPTNIGMLLVSTLAAKDLGYIGIGEFLDRIDKTLKTIEKLDKWEGHLYNWYDTVSLQPLMPRYVSTVDSGNMIGYLMVLKQALIAFPKEPTVGRNMALGLRDTIALFNEEYAETGLQVEMEPVEQLLSGEDIDLTHWKELLDSILSHPGLNDAHSKLKRSWWGKKLLDTASSFKKELEELQTDQIIQSANNLIRRIDILIEETRFTPLYDAKRQLFSIGYSVEEGRLSKAYYDLFASEARQASFIAVARGEVDKKHWFRLGRRLTMVDEYRGLVSWTGTAFEYLMPLLIMKNYKNTLLDETYNFVVKAQERYGRKRGIPWGTSESAFYSFDRNLNYQYKAFGVPELGLKRGLVNDMVVAPYASILAVGICPQRVVENLKRLEKEGLDGIYGMYEAVDYTPSRLSRNENSNVVKNFMVHHLGMSILALDNFLNGNIMQVRFHTDPVVRCAELLLQEKVPSRAILTKEHKETHIPAKKNDKEQGDVIRKFGIPESELPNMHVLSNGNYSVMVTDGGAGYSKLGDMAVTRWREGLRDNLSGMFIFIQSINSNMVWSATYQPLNDIPDEYCVVFSPDKAKFLRKDGNIETRTDIIVSTEDDAEIRRVSLTNHSQHPRVLEITSYFEVVLMHPDADLAHPAFGNLFVTTEFVSDSECLIASRRPRSEKQQPIFAFHMVTVEGEAIGDIQYETDRAKFIGRDNDLHNPLAMGVDQPLSNTEGPVLDPIMSLRRRVKIEPGQTARVTYVAGVAHSREQAIEIAEKYHETRAVERAFELAHSRSRIESGFLGFKATEVELYLKMISSILLPSPIRRRWAEEIVKNTKGQPALWPFGISGDIPIALLLVNDREQVDTVVNLLKGHEYWRMKGINVDLVFLMEDENSYIHPLQDMLRDAIAASHARELFGKRGGVFLLDSNQISEEERVLLFTAARIVLKADEGPIKEQLQESVKKLPEFRFPAYGTTWKEGRGLQKSLSTCQYFDASGLMFFNGTGGFYREGTEYVTVLKEGQYTPAPWINVISNSRFGFQISASGSGYVWAENSRENKLTPWFNDPVSDPPGEAIYLRDERDGKYWGIPLRLTRNREEYTAVHGFGYSSFEQNIHGLEQQLTVFVPLEEPVKISLITLKNCSGAERVITVTYYARPVMGVSEKSTVQYLVIRRDEKTGGLLAANSFNSDFPGRIMFMEASETERSVTGDRLEFLGTDGSLREPQAMKMERLSGTVGAGLDPCLAIQVKIKLGIDEQKELVFLLGQGADEAEAIRLAEKYREPKTARKALEDVKKYWQEKLGVLQVHTPDTSMNIMLNGWLLYQVISCRLWARSAFYQSGGAYGYRDQLQDVMAVSCAMPEYTRKQILLHASHQFVDGDVQHWWHPGADKGIRTRYSDDFLWLPYVTVDYLEVTGDWSILDEEAYYIEDEPLKENEDERYNIPKISGEKSSIYEHCIRAVERALRFGEHNLPLMGCGDWNDGMNTVGNKGKGESVWLGWFLYSVLDRFIPVCVARGDQDRAEKYRIIADEIARSIEENAWDGSWYRRAYFDDGAPLGSARNSECRIDAIAQSWSVISGAGRKQRAEEAMKAVENHLIDRQEGIIKLLTPPFYEGNLQPGYIKGYVPGVRENGGQYTHAAIWTVLAFAKMGQGDKAWELFNMINPINHSRTPIESSRYKVEPYVMAADVYAVHPNMGRGGWTWYTGAAGWMYRVGMEYILGIRKRGETLCFDPCIPKGWCEYRVDFRYEGSIYHIYIKNPQGIHQGVVEVSLDGTRLKDGVVPLSKDGTEHEVEVIMG